MRGKCLLTSLHLFGVLCDVVGTNGSQESDVVIAMVTSHLLVSGRMRSLRVEGGREREGERGGGSNTHNETVHYGQLQCTGCIASTCMYMYMYMYLYIRVMVG